MKTLQEIAGIIKNHLASKNINVPYNTALETAARVEGYKNLHHAQADLAKTAQSGKVDESDTAKGRLEQKNSTKSPTLGIAANTSEKLTPEEISEILSNLVTRDDAGTHFTSRLTSYVRNQLEKEGFITITRPVDGPTGIPYSEEYWGVEITDEGLALIESCNNELFKDFLRGFAEAAGLDHNEADEQWAAWSRNLSDREREAREHKGYDGGIAEGKTFKQFFKDEPDKKRIKELVQSFAQQEAPLEELAEKIRTIDGVYNVIVFCPDEEYLTANWPDIGNSYASIQIECYDGYGESTFDKFTEKLTQIGEGNGQKGRLWEYKLP